MTPKTDSAAIQRWKLLFWLAAAYNILVALHPTRYPGIVILAVLGKFGVFLTFTLTYLSGLSSFLMLLGGLGDLLFSLLFLVFLSKNFKWN